MKTKRGNIVWSGFQALPTLETPSDRNKKHQFQQSNLTTMSKHLIFIALCLLTSSSALDAQIANVWEGGFPGQETNWHCHKNWSLSRVPDVFDAVVIPDVSTTTRHYPIVSSGEEIEVQSIDIQSGAMLTLSRSARILTDYFVCTGTCKSCEWRVVIEGAVPPITASRN
jgi:hypothetical protein